MNNAFHGAIYLFWQSMKKLLSALMTPIKRCGGEKPSMKLISSLFGFT